MYFIHNDCNLLTCIKSSILMKNSRICVVLTKRRKDVKISFSRYWFLQCVLSMFVVLIMCDLFFKYALSLFYTCRIGCNLSNQRAIFFEIVKSRS